MKSIAKVLEETKGLKRPKNLSKEFQEYGVYLADTLGDPKHYSLYIKLAKQLPRNLLEEALSFTKGYLTAKNKARVFMWRLKQLKNTFSEKKS
ncbi:hypothetical protein HYS93_00830 [Candidatus Daviesbacteria bacterium]|nr:hypothetical protein [Candidatus Daviesbacteria bacterium]